MKLQHLFPELDPNQGEIIAVFGNAKLVKTHTGDYRLFGGSGADRFEAAEWISLFMHEVVVPP
jgi:hypothetical protein